jgi:hypothetical protein
MTIPKIIESVFLNEVAITEVLLNLLEMNTQYQQDVQILANQISFDEVKQTNE